MKKYRREVKYIVIFFAFLTVATFLTNMDQRVDITKIPAPNAAVMNKSKLILQELKRTPASDATTTMSSIVKEFFCGFGARNNVSEFNQDKILINFSTCLEDSANIESFNIENKRNGFKAHVFVMDQNKYKTDFVQLSPGENLIEVEVILKNGQKNLDSFEILFVHNSKQ